jgi:HAD superfamily hydrolase (TIGR01509 family)
VLRHNDVPHDFDETCGHHDLDDPDADGLEFFLVHFLTFQESGRILRVPFSRIKFIAMFSETLNLLRQSKAVIFDLDGTLINSLDVWSRVDATLIGSLTGRVPPSHELHAFQQQSIARHKSLPNPYTGYCADLGLAFGIDLPGEMIHRKRYEISRQLLTSEVRLRDGAAELLHGLKALGKRLALATTTRRANVDIYSDKNMNIRAQVLFRDVFESMLAMEDVERKKPDPEVYEKTLQVLGLNADECVVIEDSLEGVRAARAAGIPVVAVVEKWSASDSEQIGQLALTVCPDLHAVLQLFAG